MKVWAGSIERRVRHRAQDVGGEIAIRRIARREAHACDERRFHSINPERPPILTAHVPCDQIPSASGICEPVRLDLTRTRGVLSADVAELKTLVVAASARDDR